MEKIQQKDFRIPFAEPQHWESHILAARILEMPGLPFDKISFDQLILDRGELAKPLSQFIGGQAFGRGIYIFRKQEGDQHWPVYVGKAPHEFLKRFFMHYDPSPKPGYGFNAMLHYISNFTLGIDPGMEGMIEGRNWLRDRGSVVLLDFPADDIDRRLKYWEPELIKALYGLTQKPEWMQQWQKRRHKYIQPRMGND
jgi:hypothetical protein